jgi:hypothetical protein
MESRSSRAFEVFVDDFDNIKHRRRRLSAYRIDA